MKYQSAKRLALVAAVFLVAIVLSASANADPLRQDPTGGVGAITGSLPGQALWTYYETTETGVLCHAGFPPDGDSLCNNFGAGDNVIRLINPNGAANPSFGGPQTMQPVCAMIYVFDDDEEMGECCGCPLSSAQLATFSVERNLTSNWGLPGGPEGGDHGNGGIAIVAGPLNTALIGFIPGLTNGQGCVDTQSGACNGGCDPTNTPGYNVTTANNLLGSVTHNQALQDGPISSDAMVSPVIYGITESALSDDAGGDPTNLTYLQTQCGALVGNGSGSGICHCPLE